jgi:hypothetical protein
MGLRPSPLRTRLAVVRQERGLTYKEFANKLGGISPDHLKKLELGREPLPVYWGRKIAKVFKVNELWILGGGPNSMTPIPRKKADEALRDREYCRKRMATCARELGYTGSTDQDALAWLHRLSGQMLQDPSLCIADAEIKMGASLTANGLLVTNTAAEIKTSLAAVVKVLHQAS